jgi:hypothetical protein
VLAWVGGAKTAGENPLPVYPLQTP